MTNQEIEQKWSEYYPKVFGYFYRRVDYRSDVEDLTSVTLTGFFKALMRDGHSIPNPNAYLWRIARNQLINFIDKKSKQPVFVPLEDYDVLAQDPFEESRSTHYQSQITQVMECVQKHLQGIDLHIIQQVVMLDRKATEVAEELNLKSDNVRQKMSRSLKKLKSECKDLWKVHTH